MANGHGGARNGAGRPTPYTPELGARIARRIERGSYLHVAAEAEGISRGTLYAWCTRGERGKDPFAEFVADIARANATKTHATKFAPIHPTLAAVLARWRADGWAITFGRARTEDDLVVPTRKGTPRHVNNATTFLHEDCRLIGIRSWGIHTARRSFAS